MSTTFRNEITIAAPQAAVMDAITDLERWPQWLPGLIAVEKLTEGPVDLGTQWRETREVMRQRASEVFQVTEFEPPARLGLHVDGTKGSTGKGEYRYLYLLEPVENGSTRVLLEGEIEMPGRLAGLLSRVLAPIFRRQVQRDLVAMKGWVEGRMGDG